MNLAAAPLFPPCLRSLLGYLGSLLGGKFLRPRLAALQSAQAAQRNGGGVLPRWLWLRCGHVLVFSGGLLHHTEGGLVHVFALGRRA